MDHLHMEISRSNYFLILLRATLNCIVTDESYHSFPIAQSSLEILCNQPVRSVLTSQNRSITANFETLADRFYMELADEMLMG